MCLTRLPLGSSAANICQTPMPGHDDKTRVQLPGGFVVAIFLRPLSCIRFPAIRGTADMRASILRAYDIA